MDDKAVVSIVTRHPNIKSIDYSKGNKHWR